MAFASFLILGESSLTLGAYSPMMKLGLARIGFRCPLADALSESRNDLPLRTEVSWSGEKMATLCYGDAYSSLGGETDLARL